jgi:hypothetical protein
MVRLAVRDRVGQNETEGRLEIQDRNKINRGEVIFYSFLSPFKRRNTSSPFTGFTKLVRRGFNHNERV